MAKLTITLPFVGSIGAVTVFRQFGAYYVRARSSLTAKRVKTDPAFRKTMQYAALLSRAARIASKVYSSLPAQRKQHTLYRKLTGEAMTWLKYAWLEEEIVAYLLQQYGQAIASADGVCVRIREPLNRTTRQGATSEKLLQETAAEPYCWQQYACRLQDRAVRREINASMKSYP